MMPGCFPAHVKDVQTALSQEPSHQPYPAQTALKTALQDLRALAVTSKQKFLDDVDRYKKENPDCQNENTAA